MITEDATADAGGAVAALKFAPGLEKDTADNTVVNITVGNFAENMAFHRLAFALGKIRQYGR